MMGRPKSTTISPRAAQMRDLRLAGHRASQIATIMGVSGERVRQVRVRWFPELERPPRVNLPKPVRRYTTRGMRMALGRILKAAGWRWCCACRQVLDLEDFSTRSFRCRACTAENTRRYYHTPHGKEKAKKWQQQNTEKARAYQQKWQRKHAAYNAEMKLFGKLEAKAPLLAEKVREGEMDLLVAACKARVTSLGRLLRTGTISILPRLTEDDLRAIFTRQRREA